MIWIIIVVIVVFILYKFLTDLKKDEIDLKGMNASKRFERIVTELNKEAFQGKGNIKISDKRTFHIYEAGRNEIIFFQYGTGILTVEWRYKYNGKEVIHKKQDTNAREMLTIEQNIFASQMIREMSDLKKELRENAI